jgi:Holliday junction resolvase
MMEHEARGQLTEQVLLKGLRANAFSVVRTQGTNLQGM